MSTKSQATRMQGSGQRLPALRRQLAECIGWPAIAAVLPWPLAWRVIRARATRGRAFVDEAARALAACEVHGSVADHASWLVRHRTMRIVDHVDPAISAARGDRWMDRHLRVDGDPIPAQPSVFVGFHYGTGFWSLRHLHRLGHRVAFVSAPIEATQMAGDPLRRAFLRWRQRRVENAGSAPVIYIGGSSDRIRKALEAGVSVLALIDVPESTTSTVSVPLLGHDVQFPDGIVRIAATGCVPLFGYVASFDARTGTRLLRFTRLAQDPAQAMRALASMLDAAIRDDPASWHFWSEWPRLAARPGASRAGGDAAGIR